MGRIMSFGQDGQIVRDFDKSEYDFLRRYGRTPDEVMSENVKLREFASEAFSMAFNFYHGAGTAEDLRELTVEYHELGIEVGA